MRASEDGELLPPVVVEVPDTLYLQVVDVDDCEDFPAPSEPSERTFTTERLNASDVAYVPAARAERAEAERAELRAERDAARAGQEWRPVTEPPTDNGDYLVWVKYPKEPGFHSVARWTQRFKWENNFVHPTYWQPLPTAPAPGGEEAG